MSIIQKNLKQLIITALIIVGLVLSVYATKKVQDLRNKAAVPQGPAVLNLTPDSSSIPVDKDSTVSLSIQIDKSYPVDGIQVQAEIIGKVPENFVFTPHVPEGLRVAKNTLKNTNNGKKLTLAYITNNPQNPFVNEGLVNLGSFVFTPKEEGNLNVKFSTTVSKVSKNKTAEDLLTYPQDYTYTFVTPPTQVPSSTPTPTPTANPSMSPSPTRKPTATPFVEPTLTSTPIPTKTPTPTLKPTFTPTPSPTPTPLLSNGSFETDSNPKDKLPDGWRFKKLTTSDHLVTKPNFPVLDGNQSFRFTKLNSKQKGLEQLVQTINISGGANEAITIEAFGQSQGQTKDGNAGIKLTVIYSNKEDGIEKTAKKFPRSAPAWTRKAVTITTKKPYKQIKVNFFNDNKGANYFIDKSTLFIVKDAQSKGLKTSKSDLTSSELNLLE